MKHVKMAFLLAVLLASGCTWDDSAYNTWVKDGELSLCMGACTFDPLDKEKCEAGSEKAGKENVRWVDNDYHCVDEDGEQLLNYAGEDETNIVIVNEETCKQGGGTWKNKNGYCKVRTSKGCDAVGGEWTIYNLRMIDMGNGRYVRMLEDGKTKICGDYDSVVRSEAPACDPVKDKESIALITGALEWAGMELKETWGDKNNKCPKDAPLCSVVVYGEGMLKNVSDPKVIPENMAMCSACPEGSAVCVDDAGLGCYNLLNEVKHCGRCNRKCEDGEYCNNGECVAVDCEVECAPTKVCKDGKCQCPSEEWVEYHGECYDPSGDMSCGASETGIGKACKDIGALCNPDTLTCDVCLGNLVYCPGANDNKGGCVAPWNNKEFCGVTSGCDDPVECGADEICDKGVCVCGKPGYAMCGKDDGKKVCIEVTRNDQYCGAKGRCDSVDPSSEHYRGTMCAPGYVCAEDGTCQCANDGKVSLLCKDECVILSQNETCGLKSCPKEGATTLSEIIGAEKGSEDLGSAIGNCKSLGALGECKDNGDGGYRCTCGGENRALIKIDETTGRCIDLMYDDKNCGGIDNPCSNNTACISGVCKPTKTCGDGLVFCAGLNECVNPTQYHVNDDCSECVDGYCADDGNPKNGCSGILGSNKHCSECGHRCGEGSYCEGRNCKCRRGYLWDEINKKCVSYEELHVEKCDDNSEELCCKEWYADSDGNIENGCDIYTENDPKYCGKGGKYGYKECSIDMVCKEGECFLQCMNDTYADCDKDPSNGCETNLKEDVSHCSGCNIDCGKIKNIGAYSIPITQHVDNGFPIPVSRDQYDCKEGGCCYKDVQFSTSMSGYERNLICCSGYKKYTYSGNGNGNGNGNKTRYACFKVGENPGGEWHGEP